MKPTLLLVAGLLGLFLIVAPFGATAGTLSIPSGKQVSVVNATPSTVFLANTTSIGNGTVSYNFVGSGGNDTFQLAAGNASNVFVATGLLSNSFNLTTGGGNSTFSLSSGPYSNFTIALGNFTGTQTFAISGGINCVLNETTIGPISGNALWSVNLGTNSTVSLASSFTGNQSTINLVF